MEVEIDKMLPVNIFRFTASSFSIIGNGFLLLLFCKFSRLRQSQCNLLILLLNICDFLIGLGGLISISYTSYANTNNITLFDKITCQRFNNIQGFGIYGGKTIIVAIAFDRFMAVYKPLHYSKNRSKFFIYLVASVSFFFMITTAITPMVGLDTSTKITVCSMGAASSKNLDLFKFIYTAVAVSLLFLFYGLAVIFIIRQRQSRKIFSSVERNEFRYQLKIFATVSLILLVNFIAYGIPAILNIIGIMYSFGPDVKIYTSIYAGFGRLGSLISISYITYANANNITLFDKITCQRVGNIQGFGIYGGKTVFVAIAFDRFMAIYKPLHYSKNRSRSFVYFVAGVSFFFMITTAITPMVGLDTSTKITVCSMGAASSKTLDLFKFIYTAVALSLLSLFYGLAVILIIRQRQSRKIVSSVERNEYRYQLKIFVTVSLIVLVYFVAYGAPTILSIVGIVYNLGPDVKIYASMYAGFASVISSILDITLYLFKHNEIKKCSALFIAGIFPSLKNKIHISGIFIITRSQS
ncbi:hypothetical protein FO519_005653 [Halicephalobus sp. NKZ332]|nr:hypothetical protein FO519_005653 [Halicephalobus sp. NKZ332]